MFKVTMVTWEFALTPDARSYFQILQVTAASVTRQYQRSPDPAGPTRRTHNLVSITFHKDFTMFNKQIRYSLSPVTFFIVVALTAAPIPAGATTWQVMCPPRVSANTRLAVTNAINAYAIHKLQFTMKPAVPIHSIVVVDGYALVEWTAGESGGEAGLRLNGGSWEVMSMAGGGVDLTRHGVPALTALHLRSLLRACQEGHYPHCGSNGVCTQSAPSGKPPK